MKLQENRVVRLLSKDLRISAAIYTVLSEWNWIKLILCTKWPKFTMLFYYIEMQTRSCLPDMFLPLMRPFKWGTFWSSISRGIRNKSSQPFGYPSLLNKVGLFCNFWLWLVVILMPLEIKLHAVPHLKVLITGIYTSSGPRVGSLYVKTMGFRKTWF